MILVSSLLKTAPHAAFSARTQGNRASTFNLAYYLNASIKHAVQEHNLYGVILIGESWAYFIKDKDHTACQLFHGEMSVSDLGPEDKKEALLVQMENRDGDSIVYLNEIIRDAAGTRLGESSKTSHSRRSWF